MADRTAKTCHKLKNPTLSRRDRFSDICADFVTGEKDALRYLFLFEAGKWVSADDLPGVDEELSERLEDLQDELDSSELYVNWTPLPPEDDDEYVVITFFLPSEVWAVAAIYNKAYLLSK
jgi:hypothetical protein